MRRLILFLLAVTAALSAQNGTSQSPRQALMEMLRSPDQLDKHLPEALRVVLAKLPEEQRRRQTREMTGFAAILSASPNAELFETGPIFGVFRSPKDGGKIEITVESDDLSGDTDQMELGVRAYSQNQEQELGFSPRFQVTMKLQQGAWRLAGMGFRISVDLENPKLLSQIAKAMSTSGGNSSKPYVGPMLGGIAPPPNPSIIGILRTLTTAEAAYASAYPEVGFTCRLSHLGGGLTNGEINSASAKLIDPALESGRKFGYRISLSGCGSTPSATYQVLAVPMGQSADAWSYCTDQSGVIRNAPGGGIDACIANGTPVH